MSEILQIQSTTDYRSFILLEANRGVEHKRKIIRSIQKVGLIPVPIVCNEKLEVIDGQGRLAACEELGLPVYYIQIPGLGIEHCVSMNVSQTNWSALDYIKSYAARGNQNYCRLLRLMERHPALGYKIIVAAATNSILGVDNDTVKNGNLNIGASKIGHADKVCDWLDENIVPVKNKVKGRFEYLCFALIFSYEHSGANIKRLASVVQDNAYEFSPIATVQNALAQIERFYNRNLKTSKVYFVTEYDKYLTETNAAYSKRWGRESKRRKEQNGE